MINPKATCVRCCSDSRWERRRKAQTRQRLCLFIHSPPSSASPAESPSTCPDPGQWPSARCSPSGTSVSPRSLSLRSCSLALPGFRETHKPTQSHQASPAAQRPSTAQGSLPRRMAGTGGPTAATCFGFVRDAQRGEETWEERGHMSSVALEHRPTVHSVAPSGKLREILRL